MNPIKRVVFLSVVPSPYQRDVFCAIHRRGRVEIRVHYLEAVPHDTPWEPSQLEPWENILPGYTVTWGGRRCHCNWSLPKPATDEFWVVNGAMTDLTTQCLMRRLADRTPWAFWGEVPSTPTGAFRRWIQHHQYAPLLRARLIAAVGRRAVPVYERLAPGVPVKNRPYACDLAPFAAAASRRPASDVARPVTFLFCGQMIARKGIDLLLAAFAEVVDAGHDVRLMLVGREADLPNLLAREGGSVRSRIDFAGFQSPDALPGWFARADVFILPSRHDGWGVVVNQALGSGLPCLVSDAAGASELIRDDRNGRVLPVGDTAALTRAMINLASDAGFRERLSAGARASAEALSPDEAAAFWERTALTP